MNDFTKLQSISSRCQDNSLEGDFVLSDITQIEHSTDASRSSIKLVLSGVEDYNVNGNRYKLGIDQFLIVDKHSKVNLNINDKKGVKGVCIFADQKLIEGAFKNYTSSCESLLDSPFKLDNTSLFEKLFFFNENRTGAFLKSNVSFILNKHVQNQEIDFDSFYYNLVNCLVQDQLEIRGELKKLSTAKKSTKEELFRRVSKARMYIEDNFTEKIYLDELAQDVCLSKYHFLRSFKAIYQLSPYQYLIQIRLNKAQELLRKEYSISEINNIIGFSDERNLRKALNKTT